MDNVFSVLEAGAPMPEVVVRGDENGVDCGALISDSCAGGCEVRASEVGGVMLTCFAGGNAMASTGTEAAVGDGIVVDETPEDDEAGVCSGCRQSIDAGRAA